MKTYAFTIFCLLISHLVQCQDKEKAAENHVWLDTVHNKIESGVNDSAIWVDNFFTSDDAQDKQATGSAKIRLTWAPRSRDFSQFGARVRVRVKLPKFKDKVDVVFSDYEEQERESSFVTPGDQKALDEDSFNLALRFKADDSGFSHRIGVGRGFQLFAKSKYENHLNFTEKVQLRWQTALHYYSNDGLGADIISTLDYGLNDVHLLRSDTRFFYRNESKDWLWRQSAQHYHKLNDTKGIISGIYVEGTDNPNFNVDEYLVSTRFRQQAFREWLYFEVEPFVLWRRDEGFSPSYGLALRVEGFFGRSSQLF